MQAPGGPLAGTLLVFVLMSGCAGQQSRADACRTGNAFSRGGRAVSGTTNGTTDAVEDLRCEAVEANERASARDRRAQKQAQVATDEQGRLEQQASDRRLSAELGACHVAQLATDPWGRVYVAHVGGSCSGGGDPRNPFGQDATASSGVLALGPTLKDVIFNARLGGACGDGGTQAFAAIAIDGPRLALAGTTCATNVATKNPVQAASGGGQDGFFALVSLW